MPFFRRVVGLGRTRHPAPDPQVSAGNMLEPSFRALPSLPSATWLDECLLSARTQNRVVGVRFGRTADPLCMEADEALRDAMDSLKMEELLTMYTVDLDEVTEFTYMYELRTSS